MLAALCGCLSGATALYLEQVAGGDRWTPVLEEGFPIGGLRPSALAAIIVPRPVASPASPATGQPVHDSPMDEARQVVEAFHTAIAQGDGETLRSLLAADVRYNGVVGIDAALDDQVWLGRGADRPRFLPPDLVRREEGATRVEGRFAVPFRDVAGVRGEVFGRGVWRVAERAGRPRIVQVEYDVVPTVAMASPGG